MMRPLKLTHAMVLAAGLGTRMRPLTNTLPKPLIIVSGVPLIDYCLDWLAAANISQIVINTSYRADQLEAYVATRVHPKILLSQEGEPPLETGGGVAKALPLLGDAPFLVMNSDAIIPRQPIHPISRMVDAWCEDIDFLMLLIPREKAIGWQGQGDFVMDDAGRIRRPRAGEDASMIFSGVEIIHPRAFVGCPQGAFSLSRLWNAQKDVDGWYPRVRAIIHTGDWLNVGDLAGLAMAEAYLCK